MQFKAIFETIKLKITAKKLGSLREGNFTPENVPIWRAKNTHQIQIHSN